MLFTDFILIFDLGAANDDVRAGVNKRTPLSQALAWPPSNIHCVGIHPQSFKPRTDFPVEALTLRLDGPARLDK